ncbi:MAG: hypothetical protein HKN07_03940 [Acidimicrobiia bacterium]|nr:hypothetical protein [Acidimicrobiia bacterium]
MAADTAEQEAGAWAGVAAAADAILSEWDDVPPSEAAVTGFDPGTDLERRTTPWTYSLRSHGLGELCRFAAGLALVEADGWRTDHPQLATRAYEDRRFLLSDRLLHWAVPWLDMVGRCSTPHRELAHGARDQLLDLADVLRPAPLLVEGKEGLHLPGEDSFGSLADSGLGVLGCGVLLLRATVRSLTADPGRTRSLTDDDLADPEFRETFAVLFDVAAGRWKALAGRHEGSAQLWLDLGERANATAARVRAGTISS